MRAKRLAPYLFVLPSLLGLQDGALSAEQCAKELQARWEMYQKERGG